VDRPTAPCFCTPAPAGRLPGNRGPDSVAAHRRTPWRAAGDWWNVYGTVVDVSCLIRLRYFTHKEGIRLLIVWKKGVSFDARYLNPQTA